MKLTLDEIQFIENALIEKCDFKNFDDVRNELVDHIATEIEEELVLNELSFKEAFVKVMTRWNPLILSKSWSWYENVPYVVCKLWKKLDLQLLVAGIPVAAIIAFLFIYFPEKQHLISFVVLSIITLGIASSLFLVYRKIANKTKTTMGGYALHKIYPQAFGMLFFSILFFSFYMEGDKTIRPYLFPLIYISFVMIGKAWVMQKHIKIENQLLKVL